MSKHKSSKQIPCFLQKQPSGLLMNMNQVLSPKIGHELINSKRKPSISKKMEEKTIYRTINQSRERSQSLRNIRKKKQEQNIHDQYRTNRIKRLYKKQQHIPPNEDEQNFELKCNSRQKYTNIIQDIQQPSLRLKRIRSNDSLSKNRVNKIKQQANKKTITSLKETNLFLKKTFIQSQKKIQELQNKKKQEKQYFQAQRLLYEKQMDAIRNRINKNKAQIGHLFSYETFDPFKVTIKPIIEVEEYSSLMQSLYNTNKKSLNKKEDSQYCLFQKITKNPTQTTCMQSIDDYSNIDIL